MQIHFNLHETTGFKGGLFDGQKGIMAYTYSPESQDLERYMGEYKAHPVRQNNSTIGSFTFANMKAGKVKRSEDFQTKQTMWISNEASSNTGDVFNQYFLLSRRDKNNELRSPEELILEVKDNFFKKNMRSLPIPLKKEWEDFFWEEIQEKLKPLRMVGTIPMTGYILNLPDLEFLEMLIERSHAKAEYKKFHKVVPKIKALLSIGDIKGLSLKEWKSFMIEVLGSKENFETSYPPEKQDTIVRGFELFGNNKDILSSLQTLHSASLKPISINIRLMKDEGKKKQYKSALVKILSEFKDKSSDLIAILNNFDDLFKEHHQNIKNGNWKAIEKYLATIIYDNVSEGCRDLAVTCGKASVSKEQYPLYEDLYLEHLSDCLTAPKEYPTISGDLKNSKVSWESIDMSDPRGWVVGLETHCCQHLGSIGGACVRYAAANPSTSGIFRVDEKGSTIAQSFFWLTESSKKGEYILVFDNIEVKGGSIRTSVLDAYKDFAKEMEKYSNLFRIRAITIGTGYLESFLNDLAPDTAKGENKAEIPRSLQYTDAHNQKLFKTFKLSKI